MNEHGKGTVSKKRYTKRRSVRKPPAVDSSSSSEADRYSNELLRGRIRKQIQTLEKIILDTSGSSTEEPGAYCKIDLIVRHGLILLDENNRSVKKRTKVRAAMARRTHVSSIDDPTDLEDLDSPDSIEEGILAIPNSDANSTRKEIWNSPANYYRWKMPEDNSPVLVFEILSARIMPPDGEDLKVKRYVLYEITVRQDSRIGMDQLPAKIERRYTDFRDMYSCLKRDYPMEMANIVFPNKVLVGNFSSTLIAERAQGFAELLTHITRYSALRMTSTFLDFLQDNELTKACQLLDERNDACIPLLENCFMLLNKIFMDRSKPVLLILCRLVAACTNTPVPHQSAEKWAALALNRYETLCDIDLLPLYIPLLHICAHLWWQKGRDEKPILARLTDMSKKGININNSPTLMQAIHKLDPRSETI